ncbi:MAG: hypothetical protein U1E38_05590 [Rhodospirillales bacterium]
MLTVGIGQYPASLHPSIRSMVARSYVLGLARRPFTVYDPDWQLVCMLCTAVPTLANGGAWTETTPDGQDGIAVRFTIREGSAWADGTPVTSRDVVFTRRSAGTALGRDAGVLAQPLEDRRRGRAHLRPALRPPPLRL